MNLEKSKKISLLQRAFGPGDLEPSEVNLHLHCPACKDKRKDKKKLYVFLDNGWFNCWVCGLSGKNIGFLVRKFAPKLAQEFHGVYPDDSKIVVTEDQLPPVAELPDDIVLIATAPKGPDYRDVFKYLQARGLTKMDMYRWRICVSNTFPLKRKAIFPSFNEAGELNYYTARAIDETKFKYKNAKVPKQSVIFNEIDIDWTAPIILVEGIFDAVKCPENTVSVLGSTLPKKSVLLEKLKRNRSTVVVAFDADAELKSHIVCKKLSQAGCTVFKVAIKGDDLGNRTKENVREILTTIRPWTQESMISHKISIIKSGSIL